jgi:hypothetical protein
MRDMSELEEMFPVEGIVTLDGVYDAQPTRGVARIGGKDYPFEVIGEERDGDEVTWRCRGA